MFFGRVLVDFRAFFSIFSTSDAVTSLEESEDDSTLFLPFPGLFLAV